MSLPTSEHHVQPHLTLLISIVSYVNYNAMADEEAASSSLTDPIAAQIRIEAANVVASLAHGKALDMLPGL